MTEPQTTSVRSPRGTKPVVYVVDDEAMLLELATVILEPLGYEIVTFCDPEAALTGFARARPRPDLLVTDYAMHSMNGMHLIQECRRLEPRQKILLVSGTVGPEIYGQATYKPDGYLAKPYRARQLIDLVRTTLRG
jgi:CheY-like chemotaxis protein